jgi:hypothetical protein
MAEEYLIDSRDKEREAIRRLPELLITLGHVLDEMRVNPQFAWYLLEVEMGELGSDVKGDVDILVGSFELERYGRIFQEGSGGESSVSRR